FILLFTLMGNVGSFKFINMILEFSVLFEFTEYFIVTYTFREFLGRCSRIGRVTLGVEVLGYGLGLLGAETKCTVGLRLQCTKVEWNRGLSDGLLYPHTFYRCIGAPALFKDLFDGFLLEYPAPAAFRNQ